ncbi:MAG: CAAX prenyl protease-related protein [Gemmatimonadetes bacterium]|nr:CAAX prenyl protease-related protein [Gemmatimonadota bacterium]
MLLLAGLPSLGLAPRADAIVRVAILTVVIGTIGWPVVDLRVRFPLGTIAVGVAVFAVWIAPDLLIPGWRGQAIFQNGITGRLTVSLPPEARDDLLVLALRLVRAALLVPVLEELFWRGWLPRFLDARDFQSLPLGHFSTTSFVATALLFAAEHGPFWEVGLIAGVAYNLWMQRTRSLGDLIAAHGLTNLLLGLFVLVTRRWEFWL